MLSVPEEKGEFEKDVFIVHSEVDQKIAESIYEKLEEKGYRCVAQFDTEAFNPGKPVFDQSLRWVQNSWRTLLVCTENACRSSWICLETIFALEQSHGRRDQGAPLRIITKDVPRNEIPILKQKQLTDTDLLVVDLKDNWIEKLMLSLCGMLTFKN